MRSRFASHTPLAQILRTPRREQLRYACMRASRPMPRESSALNPAVRIARAKTERHHSLTIDQHASALLDTQIPEDLGSELHLRLELAVTDPPLLPGNGRIPDDSEVVPASVQHVARNQVVARRQAPVREPAPSGGLAVGRRVGLQHRLRRRRPGETRGFLRPEGIRGGKGAGVGAGVGVHVFVLCGRAARRDGWRIGIVSTVQVWPGCLGERQGGRSRSLFLSTKPSSDLHSLGLTPCAVQSWLLEVYIS